MHNNFQKWLKSLGYTRKDGDLEWMKCGNIISGKELNKRLKEFKELNK